MEASKRAASSASVAYQRWVKIFEQSFDAMVCLLAGFEPPCL
jgi:hypothetical protein